MIFYLPDLLPLIKCPSKCKSGGHFIESSGRSVRNNDIRIFPVELVIWLVHFSTPSGGAFYFPVSQREIESETSRLHHLESKILFTKKLRIREEVKKKRLPRSTVFACGRSGKTTSWQDASAWMWDGEDAPGVALEKGSSSYWDVKQDRWIPYPEWRPSQCGFEGRVFLK